MPCRSCLHTCLGQRHRELRLRFYRLPIPPPRHLRSIHTRRDCCPRSSGLENQKSDARQYQHSPAGFFASYFGDSRGFNLLIVLACTIRRCILAAVVSVYEPSQSPEPTAWGFVFGSTNGGISAGCGNGSQFSQSRPGAIRRET